MLNFDVDLLHLQPRDDVAQLRRSAMCAALPAGNSLNEQYARAQLHAGNEADIDAALTDAGTFDRESGDVSLTTHWTRVLHHDLYGANAAMAGDAGHARASDVTLRRRVESIVRRCAARLLHSMLGWMVA